MLEANTLVRKALSRYRVCKLHLVGNGHVVNLHSFPKLVALPVGFEPTTPRPLAECSYTELREINSPNEVHKLPTVLSFHQRASSEALRVRLHRYKPNSDIIADVRNLSCASPRKLAIQLPDKEFRSGHPYPGPCLLPILVGGAAYGLSFEPRVF